MRCTPVRCTPTRWHAHKTHAYETHTLITLAGRAHRPLLVGENRRYLPATRPSPSRPAQRSNHNTSTHAELHHWPPAAVGFQLIGIYDCAHKRHVATLECNTLYLLIHPMREEPDARFGHVYTFHPFDNICKRFIGVK
jgi:hypothetical protein